METATVSCHAQPRPVDASPSHSTGSTRLHQLSKTIIRVPCRGRTHKIRVTAGGLHYLNHSRPSLSLERLLDTPQGCAAIDAALDHYDHPSLLDELPDAVRNAFEQEANAVQDWVHDEWRGLHHNARLRDFPYEDHESEIFWERLGWAVGDGCRDLSNEINGTWGFKLTFHQYGRSGATIAPSEWVEPRSCNQFGSLNDSILESCCAPHTITQALTILDILAHINRYWRDMASSVTSWWEEERRYLSEHC